MKKRARRGAWLLLVAAAVAALIYLLRESPRPGPLHGKLVIRFLDVGQGDCELLQLPEGQTILIDSGDRGAPTVDLLRSYGVRSIDLAIATHPHSDHIGEMRDVMRAFRVREFWDSGFPHTTNIYEEMLQHIKIGAIPFRLPKRGETRSFGSVSVEVLHPGPQPPDRQPNNASLVIRVDHGSRRFLFTGDAEISRSPNDQSAWREMLRETPQALGADLLKAAHHGSSNGTDKAVLDAIHPTVVTVSCKAGNDYHHPHSEFIDLMNSRRDTISLYRTDIEGTITVVSDGRSLEVHRERSVDASAIYKTGDEVAGRVTAGANLEGRRRERRAR